MGRPFPGVKRWREIKTPVFNIRVMLVIILRFINYEVGLMMNKPTELSLEWFPRVPLLSLDATLFVSFVADGRKKRFT
jgi:hypothetical protein